MINVLANWLYYSYLLIHMNHRKLPIHGKPKPDINHYVHDVILSYDKNLPWQCQPKTCNTAPIAVCITLGQNFILYASHWHPSNELGKFWVSTNCSPWQEIGMRSTCYRIDQTQVWSLLNNPGCSKAHCN